MPRRTPIQTTMLSFRLPSAVAESWRQQADRAGVSLSDFLRSAIDARQQTGIAGPGKRPARRTWTPADPELVRQLAWIGNNINQIAKWVNTNKSGIDAVELLAHLNALRRNFSFLLPSKAEGRAEGVD